MRIVVVEDDKMVAESLIYALKQNGYAVDWASDGELGDEALRNNNYNIVLLDIGLPKHTGLELLKSLRARHSKVPVLIITARDQIADRVIGLDLGADDYLVKPFALEEVEARVRVLLRRNSGHADAVIQSSVMCLNTLTKELEFQGKSLLLSAREYAIIYALLEVPGKVLSRPELEEKLYGWEEEINSNAVEVQIHNLRKKFGTDIIRNMRGIGYMVAK